MSPRPLKFRVWDRKSECLYYAGLSLNIDDGLIVDECGVFNDSDLTVQQFTGFQDKNLKDIYEGDIIKFSDVIYSVVWDELGFVGADTKLDYVKYRLDPKMLDKFKIIGNIFENKELLERK